MKTVNVAGKVMGVIVGSMLVMPIGAAFLVWVADGDAERGSFADAKIISARMILSVVALMVLLVPFFWMAHTREPGASMTWGEAMVAAVYAFFVLFWLYGVVPHEYLNWADSELSWRPDKKLIGPEGSWASWWTGWKRVPLTIHKQIFRDLIVVNIYVVGLGGFIWAAAFWNDRAKKAAAVAAIEPVSAYGRPLVAKVRG